jgi:hypothetical protein
MGKFRFQGAYRGGCECDRHNFRFGFMVNARKNRTVNWDF